MLTAIAVVLLAPPLAVVLIVALFPRSHAAELAVSFRPHWLALSIAATVAASLGPLWLLPLALVATVAHAVTLAPFFVRAVPAGAPLLSVMSFNVYGRYNTDWPATLDVVSDAAPDVVVLLESTEEAAAGMSERGYRVLFHTGHWFDQTTVAVSDSVDVLSVARVPLRSFTRPVVALTVVTPSGPLSVVGAHPRAPRTRVAMRHRNAQLVELAAWAATQTVPLVLVGDLNVTPYSLAFATLTKVCTSAHLGARMLYTWKGTRPLEVAPIDHALVKGLGVVAFRRFRRAGSDHHAVMVTVGDQL